MSSFERCYGHWQIPSLCNRVKLYVCIVQKCDEVKERVVGTLNTVAPSQCSG